MAAADGRTECLLCGRAFDQYGRAHHSYCKPCTAKTDGKLGKPPAAKCGMCGKKFASARRVAKYCSDKCRADVKRRYIREYMRKYVADPEKRAMKLARARAAAAAGRARARGGGSPSSRGRVSGNAPRNESGPQSVACGLCGRAFAPYGGSRQVYCKRCRTRIEGEVSKVMEIGCKECGKKFTTSSRAVRYCSKECRAMGNRASDRRYTSRREADPQRKAVRAAYARALASDRRARKRAERQKRQ